MLREKSKFLYKRKKQFWTSFQTDLMDFWRPDVCFLCVMSRYFLFENNNSLVKTNTKSKRTLLWMFLYYQSNRCCWNFSFFQKKKSLDKFFPNIMMAAILLLMNGVTNILLALLNKQNECLVINQKIIAIKTRKVIYMWLLLAEVLMEFLLLYFSFTFF